jgi:Methyltransferase domain
VESLIRCSAVTGARSAVQTVVRGNGLVALHNRRVSADPTGTRRLLRRPEPRRWNWSARRLNALLRGLHNAASYLEVGVQQGLTLENVEAHRRWGVDPFPLFDTNRLPRGVRFFEMTSDEFFAQLDADTRFDLVFLDGLHTFEQTYIDLVHVLAHMRDGAVLIDDTVPSDEVSAMPDQDESLRRRGELGLAGLPWHGSVWKLVPHIAARHPELEYRTILGSGNPQTLVWRARTGSLASAPASVDDSLALSYSDILAGGVPDSFRPSAEAAAIRECLAEVRR